MTSPDPQNAIVLYLDAKFHKIGTETFKYLIIIILEAQETNIQTNHNIFVICPIECNFEQISELQTVNSTK